MQHKFKAEAGEQAKINRVEITPVTFPNAAAPSQRNRIMWQVRIEHTYGSSTRNEYSFEAACQFVANYDAPLIPSVESVTGILDESPCGSEMAKPYTGRDEDMTLEGM